MFKNIADVIPGDVILEDRNRTVVRKVEVSPNSCRNKVHINEADCWEGFTQVRVQD